MENEGDSYLHVSIIHQADAALASLRLTPCSCIRGDFTCRLPARAALGGGSQQEHDTSACTGPVIRERTEIYRRSAQR